MSTYTNKVKHTHLKKKQGSLEVPTRNKKTRVFNSEIWLFAFMSYPGVTWRLSRGNCYYSLVKSYKIHQIQPVFLVEHRGGFLYLKNTFSE